MYNTSEWWAVEHGERREILVKKALTSRQFKWKGAINDFHLSRGAAALAAMCSLKGLAEDGDGILFYLLILTCVVVQRTRGMAT